MESKRPGDLAFILYVFEEGRHMGLDMDYEEGHCPYPVAEPVSRATWLDGFAIGRAELCLGLDEGGLLPGSGTTKH